jgi:hypothetical protein
MKRAFAVSLILARASCFERPKLANALNIRSKLNFLISLQVIFKKIKEERVGFLLLYLCLFFWLWIKVYPAIIANSKDINAPFFALPMNVS